MSNHFVYTFNYKNCILIQVDSDFDLTEVDLNLPEGPITCLDCITESLDHRNEAIDQYALCVLGSTDNSVKFVRLRYGYVNKVCFAFLQPVLVYMLIMLHLVRCM